MLKNILNLEGAQKLTKNEQKIITGGITEAMAQCLADGCVMQTVSPGAGWVTGCGGSSRIWCNSL
ncbi:hypothetical protein [Flavobacterium sp. ZB4P13]|uniref:hypothetical protein n=1 Tax=Flavobacterium sp. ZB4P13 TaxID=3401728 RepID=UPI003AB0CBA8